MVSRSGQWLNEIAANPPDIAVISTYGFLVGRAIDTATLLTHVEQGIDVPC